MNSHDFDGIMKNLMSASLMWVKCFSLIKKMSEINMHKIFNTLWEFTGGKEDKDNFIQQVLKKCKVFKVKPLKAPRPDLPSKKAAYNLSCKDIRIIKKELQGVPVSKASATISKEWKKVKASDKKMKKQQRPL